MVRNVGLGDPREIPVRHLHASQNRVPAHLPDMPTSGAICYARARDLGCMSSSRI
jgi:hypothetical protein